MQTPKKFSVFYFYSLFIPIHYISSDKFHQHIHIIGLMFQSGLPRIN